MGERAGALGGRAAARRPASKEAGRATAAADCGFERTRHLPAGPLGAFFPGADFGQQQHAALMPPQASEAAGGPARAKATARAKVFDNAGRIISA